MYEVGLRRESKWDGSPSTKKYLTGAIEWFKKSAMKGNYYASFKVGYYYTTGDLGKIDYAEAVKWLEKVTRAKNTNGNEYWLLGQCYFMGGNGVVKDLDKAQEYFIKGCALNNSDCYNLLAYVYAEKKLYDKAFESIDHAIKISPNFPDYYDSKGEIYLMMGKEDEALKMWGKVMELNPKFLDNYPQGTELYNKLKAKGKIK